MAIVKNVGKHAVILSSGLDLGLLQTANVDPAAPNEAAMIAAGILIITDGSVSPSPPASPPPLGIPNFQAFTAYPAGYVIVQSRIIYQATIAFTSGASFNAGDWTSISSGTSATPTIVSPGNLGATYTLSLSSGTTWLVGTLNANCTITLSGLAAGMSFRLLLSQDATGGRTLTVNDGSGPLAVPIPSAANATAVVHGMSDGTNTYIT